jgi:hypothetical protein
MKRERTPAERSLLLAAAITTTLALICTGCGSGTRHDHSNQSDLRLKSLCVLTPAGTKLCGSDGQHWCKEYGHPGEGPCAQIIQEEVLKGPREYLAQCTHYERSRAENCERETRTTINNLESGDPSSRVAGSIEAIAIERVRRGE